MRALLAVVVACGVAAPAVDAAPQRTPSAVKKQPKAKKQSRKVRKKARKPAPTTTWKSDGTQIDRPSDGDKSPAYRYTQLTAPACKAELARRKIAFTEEPATRGVRMPIRLAGTLHGIEYRTNLKPAQRATTPWEIVDCRLVLALDDFSVILAAEGVVDVRHYSMYRRPPDDWPADKIGTRHPGALAIDVARLIMKDGSYLDVDKHFNGAIGAKTCGPDAAPSPVTPEALKLRGILCKAVEQRLFHVVLTPNYNAPHKNHFHLEITEGWKSFLVN
jgi:hypothetical protein